MGFDLSLPFSIFFLGGAGIGRGKEEEEKATLQFGTSMLLYLILIFFLLGICHIVTLYKFKTVNIISVRVC